MLQFILVISCCCDVRAALSSVHMTGHGEPAMETTEWFAGTSEAPGDGRDENEKNRKEMI